MCKAALGRWSLVSLQDQKVSLLKSRSRDSEAEREQGREWLWRGTRLIGMRARLAFVACVVPSAQGYDSGLAQVARLSRKERQKDSLCARSGVFSVGSGGKAACGSGQTYPEKEQKRVTEQDEGTDGKNSQGRSPRRGAQCDQTGQYFISPERGRRPHSKHADAVYCIPFPRNHLRGHFAEGSLRCVEHVLFITTLSKSDKTSAADMANQLTQEFR